MQVVTFRRLLRAWCYGRLLDGQPTPTPSRDDAGAGGGSGIGGGGAGVQHARAQGGGHAEAGGIGVGEEDEGAASSFPYPFPYHTTGMDTCSCFWGWALRAAGSISTCLTVPGCCCLLHVRQCVHSSARVSDQYGAQTEHSASQGWCPTIVVSSGNLSARKANQQCHVNNSRFGWPTWLAAVPLRTRPLLQCKWRACRSRCCISTATRRGASHRTGDGTHADRCSDGAANNTNGEWRCPLRRHCCCCGGTTSSGCWCRHNLVSCTCLLTNTVST